VALFAAPVRAVETQAPAAATDAPSYIRFNPIFVPVIDGNRVTHEFGVTLMIQLVQGQDKTSVEAKREQLNDAFIRDLYAFFQDRASFNGRVDEAYLKTRLLRAANAVVGPGVVQEVLIEQLLERAK